MPVPPDPLELLTIEREIRELSTSAETFADARAECGRAIERACAEAGEIAERLHVAEELARERRRDRGDIVLRRVDLERELNEALEVEALASVRSAQLAQRAAGLRAAAAFASSNRADAELAKDPDRAAREDLTVRRAEHEARLCESQAAEALGEEQRVTKIRKHLEERVDAIREEEAMLNRRRDEAEAILADVRDEMERAQAEVDRASAEAARLDAEVQRYGEKRMRTERRLRTVRDQAKVRLEVRLAELRATETSLRRQREEIERLIAVIDAEGPIEEPLDFGLLEQLPALDAPAQSTPSLPVPVANGAQRAINGSRRTAPSAAAPAKPVAKRSAPRPANPAPANNSATPGDGSIGVGLARMLVGTFFPRADKAPKNG